jgi:hypothetical protein
MTLMLYGFIIRVLLFGLSRGSGEVGRTFSCRFEEIRHLLFWDSIVLMIGFLVFEFEVVFIVIFIFNVRLATVVIVFLVMVIEVLSGGFGY